MTRRQRVALGFIVLVAFAFRIWWSGAWRLHPEWSDPDGYGDLSRALAGPHGWRWTTEAVTFAEFTKAPLYQVLLSGLWRMAPRIPFVAAALSLHALLNASTALALYLAASRLHSRRAGLIAAAVYAVWMPNILPTATFWQEQLFIPAVCWAMACVVVATTSRRPAHFVLAGLLFGVAALTRSSVTYFVLPASAVLALTALPRRRACAEAGLLLAGFALLVLPYVMYVSAATGRVTFVENIGYYSLKHFDSVSPADPSINLLQMMHEPAGPPSTGEVLQFLGRDFAASPGRFALRRFDFLRLLVKPAGASFIAGCFTATRTAARWLEAGVHFVLDVPFAAALLLAPFGVVLARNRRAALVLMLWPPIYLGLVALMLWAGTRFRAPTEPLFIVFAAVVVVGDWRRASLRSVGAATAVTLLMALLLAISLPSVAGARANYGVAALPRPGATVMFQGEMGAFVTCLESSLTLSLRADSDGPIRLRVSVDGRPADDFILTGTLRRRYALDAPRRVYLEISAVGDQPRLWLEQQ